MILPTEPIRGLTVKKYLSLAWCVDQEDGDLNVMAQIMCSLFSKKPEEMKELPAVIQVYWFERAKDIMLTAISNSKEKP